MIGNKAAAVKAHEGENLLEIWRQNAPAMRGIRGRKKLEAGIEAACGGNGTCGKCRVRILHGNAPVTKREQMLLTQEEIADGIRLACQTAANDDLTVEILQGNEAGMASGFDMNILGVHTETVSGVGALCRTQYRIAADLGSTTLAAVLLDAEGKIVRQACAINSQRAYGADVISRIQASSAGKQKELQACSLSDLNSLFQKLLLDCDTINGNKNEIIHVTCIAIAGNTTMLHLLRGYSCEGLGQAPFAPVSLEMECLAYRELFSKEDLDVPCGFEDSIVYLLPGMSAFVGADITAGLYSSGFWQTPEDKLALFLDLGTNGELALGNRAGFLTASTAAGPVFEGGGLSCGMPAVDGAVCGVSFLYHRPRLQTIGCKKPIGICGTGALEAVAALLQEGLLNADGLLAPQLFENGFLLAKNDDGSTVRLTQADIRSIQLAKAAIRAGIETLLRHYQNQKQQLNLSRIYLVGGFGHYLSADTAAAVGLFAPQWKDKAAACGNTSLKGVAAFLTDPACAAELEAVRKKCREVSLAEDAYFQEQYIQRMQFPNAEF